MNGWMDIKYRKRETVLVTVLPSLLARSGKDWSEGIDGII
jgi:hypothetical protein